ncbi:MAG: S9 family peptidase [Trueperaceae bacterium]|nr:S9 family peptidase [Trueperaceae bacterium]
MPKFKPEHLLELNFVSHPVLSPSGKLAVSVQTSIEKDDDEVPYYQSHIFLQDLRRTNAKQLTRSGFANTQPSFSPNSKQLAYLSKQTKDGPAQLYLMPLDGGEGERLTNLKTGVSAYSWSPDGNHIAFLSRGDNKPETGHVKEISSLRYKQDGIGFLPPKAPEIYLLELKKRQLEVVARPEHDSSDLVFSPDGKFLYFISGDDPRHAFEWQKTIFRLSLKTQKIKRLLDQAGMVSNLSLSPDGNTLLFNAPCRWDVFASPTGLYSLSAKGGEPNLLTAELDAIPSIGADSRYGTYPNKAVWLDHDKVIININQDARSALSQLQLSSGTLEPLHSGDIAISSFAAQGDKLLFTAETPNHPGELFIKDEKGLKQLTKLNSKLAKKYQFLSPSEAVALTTDSEHEIRYWKLEPSKPRKDGALVIQVHGGPHTNYGYGFFHEFQMLAAAGYTVIYGNPRGGSSFGDDFATTILGRYGTVDADDVLAMARDAKKQHSKKNAPIHLTGGSYGGFMTNWLVGQTDEFQSAVTQRSICNWTSFFGSSDIGSWFSPIEVGGNPWEHTELLWQQSPLKHVAKVKTPTLVIHSEEDHRCPIEQGEQFYTALKSLGVDTRFVRFPDEGHELSRSGRPDRRIKRLNEIISWFETHA